MLKALLVLSILVGAPAAALAAPKPDWTAYADCAAAYRANSRIKDPARAPSMKASIADQAGAYEVTARARYHDETLASAPAARRLVGLYVDRRTRDFSRQSRDQMDRFIEACPQPEG